MDAVFFNTYYRLLRSFRHVQKQLQCLWHPVFLEIVFSDLLDESAGMYICMVLTFRWSLNVLCVVSILLRGREHEFVKSRAQAVCCKLHCRALDD